MYPRPKLQRLKTSCSITLWLLSLLSFTYGFLTTFIYWKFTNVELQWGRKYYFLTYSMCLTPKLVITDSGRISLKFAIFLYFNAFWTLNGSYLAHSEKNMYSLGINPYLAILDRWYSLFIWASYVNPHIYIHTHTCMYVYIYGQKYPQPLWWWMIIINLTKSTVSW